MLLKTKLDTPLGMVRHATRVVHERLHYLELFQRLLAQTITQDEYCSLLESLYGFHQPIEAALLAHPEGQALAPMSGRCRAHLLLEDLIALRGGRHRTAANLPLATPPMDLLAHPGGFLGCLYVREGAMLGGRVLAGKLDPLLGGHTEGRRFFSGTPDDTESWRSCCSAIDRLSSRADIDGMISAALATFELFENWMTRADTNHGVTV